MIPLEKQCVSLELSKRLKDLGVKQESFFYWDTMGDGSVIAHEPYQNMKDHPKYMVSAFTVAELGEMLPLRLMCTVKVDGQWMGYQNWELMIEGDFAIHAKTEADCRAKMLIYLVENGWFLCDEKGTK
jgi:hypothetical protein